jgi:hypothetical protein
MCALRQSERGRWKVPWIYSKAEGMSDDGYCRSRA